MRINVIRICMYSYFVQMFYRTFIHASIKYRENILNSPGLSYMWSNQTFFSLNWFKYFIREPLKLVFTSMVKYYQWFTQM